MITARRLASLFIAAALTLALPFAAQAEPAAPVETTSARQEPSTPSSAPAGDEQYAGREASSQSAADFKGGDAVIITSSVLVVVLVVVLILVIL
jgi:hypothetical protein